MDAKKLLQRLGVDESISGGHYNGGQVEFGTGGECLSENPATGKGIAGITRVNAEPYGSVAQRATDFFRNTWRQVPAPTRGLLIRDIADDLWKKKTDLGELVSLETGKIRAEGEGEVQEMIDIAHFAVGLSRQLYGKTMPSERVGHSIRETWLPLGPVGVITAFNFPVAVFSWNAFIAAVCGDTVIWKPSPKIPLTAIVVQHICERVAEQHGFGGVFSLCLGGADIGMAMAHDPRLPLVSATGSCAMGRAVGTAVAARLGRTLLELGGNNAVVVMDDANLPQAVRAILFGAVGTAGQRCTTTRRVIVHKAVVADLKKMLVAAFGQVKIGDPLDPRTLMGPLIDADAVEKMMGALRRAVAEGGKVLYGGKRIRAPGYFVEPTIVAADRGMSVVKEETFAPILYIIECESLEEAIALNNDASYGLSSAIFTESIINAERFLCATGSDCGHANVDTGTSGAEIGGAFGGEKDTGGGREAGSDAWKAYMRRQTAVINYSGDLPLAQGIQFGS